MMNKSEHTDTGMMEYGQVFRKSTGQYFVKADGKIVVCSISSTLRKHLVYPTADPTSVRPHVVEVKDIKTVDPVAIGDMVSFVDAGNDSGMITEILPRRNKLSRSAAGRKPLEQVIVANIDQVIPVVAAARPAPKWRLLDRYLADAEAAGIPVLICITKLDLADENRLMEGVGIYERIGYPAVLTSAVSGKGIDECKEMLEGRISVLVGKSGVGKTTLLNAIQPGLGLRVREVSGSTGKGKHTTSHLELFELDCGGGVVDTPGMREFSLWDIDGTDVASLFPEMRPYIGHCRFGLNCSHTHEPECAIKEAVEAGDIAESRYESYVRMKR
jgi:ribosome biogenesis GTPase